MNIFYLLIIDKGNAKTECLTYFPHVNTNMEHNLVYTITFVKER